MIRIGSRDSGARRRSSPPSIIRTSAQIYGIEDEGRTIALVLELVEGPTLADRIARGPMALADALAITRQIAAALEAAHSQSIIHRDLKPANVKVKDDGTVKVLDFGLAKAFEAPSAVNAEAANSPTLTNRATALGVILGTAAYMAPEQAKGKVVDRRADVWAFGVVLYEMLTGRRLFGGEDVSDTLASVLKTDPDWTALPATTPAGIQRLLRRCLERDPNRRLHDIADARLEIEDALVAPAAPAAVSAARPGRRERLLWLAAIAGSAILSAIVTRYLGAPVTELPETRLQILTPLSPGQATPLAMSPDGRSVAFWALADGKSQLWVRHLGADEAKPLPGTAGGGALWWMPDGRSIVYTERQLLKQVPLDGGVAHALPASVTGFGFTRNADGLILFAPANAAPISRVHESGGTPAPATRVNPPQIGHRSPFFLPDGRHFVFLASGPPGVQGIYLGALDSLESRRLVAADTAPVFAAPDFIVFGRQDTLFAQRLNMRTFEIEGETIFVADRPLQNRTVFGSVAVAASVNGSLAYRQAVVANRRLMWRDRSGKEAGQVGALEAVEADSALNLSPDGRTVALSRRVNGNTDLWTIGNAPQGAMQRFTSDPAVEFNPIWSPDGKQMAFQSARKGGGFYDLFQKPVDGSSGEVVLLESAENKTMNDWSRDNKFILYVVQGNQQVPRDLWALPLDHSQKPFPVTQSPYDETYGRFSPDSRWVAYQSTASGTTTDVYVRRFPGPGREWRISTGGGIIPKWRGDGRELYYISPDNQILAVTMTLSPTSDLVEHGTPAPLFRVPNLVAYTPAADGQKFLVNEILGSVSTPPITVIMNWRRK